MNKQYVNQILEALSGLIMQALELQRSNEGAPGVNVDEEEQRLARCTQRVRVLRDLRESFENEIAWPL